MTPLFVLQQEKSFEQILVVEEQKELTKEKYKNDLYIIMRFNFLKI